MWGIAADPGQQLVTGSSVLFRPHQDVLVAVNAALNKTYGVSHVTLGIRRDRVACLYSPKNANLDRCTAAEAQPPWVRDICFSGCGRCVQHRRHATPALTQAVA